MPPKKSKSVVIKEPEIETLAVLNEQIESDEEIQAPTPPPPATPKPKRVMTDKQREGLAKGRELAHARRMHKDLVEKKREALKQKQIMVDEKKKAVEDKLIKTAVAIKKKQLLEEARLKKFTEGIEDDIPDEVVKSIIREKKNPPKPVLKREPPTPPPPNPFGDYYFL